MIKARSAKGISRAVYIARTLFLIALGLFWLLLIWLAPTMTLIFTALTSGAVVGLFWLIDTLEDWEKADQES
jgi:hypothetical protein